MQVYLCRRWNRNFSDGLLVFHLSIPFIKSIFLDLYDAKELNWLKALGIHNINMPSLKPIVILALDLDCRSEIRTHLKNIGDRLSWVKIGLQSYLRDGPDLVNEIADLGKKIFLDLKLHDIPNTMIKSLRSLSSLPIGMLTLHSSAGSEALSRCVEEAKNSMPDVTLLGVTVLTSMDKDNLMTIGIHSNIEEQVIRLAKMSTDCGIQGIVCSPQELRLLRSRIPTRTKLVTPGIRPIGSALEDQKRIMTPAEAKEAGADYLVIGRPILTAVDPAQALDEIIRQISYD